MTLAEQSRAYIGRHRARKSTQLAFLLWSHGFTSSQVASMSDHQWELAAAAASLASGQNVNPPRSSESKCLTIQKMKDLEAGKVQIA